MIHYFEGTVFNCDADAIVNTVNCTGVMGAGLALEFMLRYPEMYNQYKIDCEKKKYQPGSVEYYKDSKITIINFATKWHFKYPSNINWIETGLKNFVNTYKSYNLKSVAFPKLGTLNGGLNWEEVKIKIEYYLADLDVDIYICLDKEQSAQGLEKDMVDYFNKNAKEVLNNIAKINTAQKQLIMSSAPISRFWHLSKLKGVGLNTYIKLYNTCLKGVTSPEANIQQISMFNM